MLAIRTGVESGIVVIDVDVDTAKGIDGRGWLIEAQQKGLPDCPIAETPRGGMHLYFAHPGGSVPCSVGRLGKGVDVRGDGGYVIAPPSKSPKGEYRWRPGSTAETAAAVARLAIGGTYRRENRRSKRPLGAANGGGPLRSSTVNSRPRLRG